jgi:hypothetical protein
MKPLTLEEHRELGDEILKTRARLMSHTNLMVSVYGPHSRAAASFEETRAAMEKLCSELQNQAEHDCPGLNAASFYR